MIRSVVALSLLFSLLCVAVPASLQACACGCGVFDVQTSGMLPTEAGGLAFLEFDGMNQNQNWSGGHKAPSQANPDQQIRTGFFTAGVHYMFDRRWGLMAELPYWSRYYKTADDSGNIGAFTHSAAGDFRLRGVFTGFSADMSSGLTFGLKLPTGDITFPNFDRDTEIGTGSTDLLLGGYHMGRVAGTDSWAWFSNLQWDQPVLTAGGYRPGSEVDAALGAYFDRWRVAGVKAAPIAQLVGSHRWRDSGTFGDAPNSGYDRVLVSPGVELSAGAVRLYADVGFPVYQYVNGDQLVSPQVFKLSAGYAF